MTTCHIYDHLRTPRGRGKKDGALHDTTALELATQTLRTIHKRNHLHNMPPDDVILGCVDPVGEQGGNIARAAALNADYDDTTPGVQINRFCASGLEAVNMAAAQIMAGQAQLTIAGGVESMSRIPMGSSGGAWPTDPALAIKAYFTPQGISADLIATKWGFSRHDADAYAVESHKRAINAWDNGWFSRSVIPVTDINGVTLLDRDEHLRPDTSMQSLAALSPAFADIGAFAGFDDVALQRYPEFERLSHIHHAGNSSGIVDGAAAVLLASKEAGDALGLTPRAKIRAFASIGSEPCIMLTAPADAARKALKHANMQPSDIDLYEVNEAFASVVMLFMQLMEADPDRVNVNGGAIAMGHPLGATGAMILGTVLDEMERRDLNTALTVLCIGAGMGTATIIERV